MGLPFRIRTAWGWSLVSCAVLTAATTSWTLRAAETSVPRDADPAAVHLDRLKRHAGFLASDALEGREAGSRGGRAAAAYLVHELRGLGLLPAGSDRDFQQPFGKAYANVLARLPGDDPQRGREFVVVGAHYDHVGFGNASNSFGPYGRIHNGADDNASGVSLVLELAARLKARGALPRTVIFAFWDAEESGMFGSAHWVKSPTVPREGIKAAVNVDMVGRLRDNQVTVMGWRTAAGLRQYLATANDATHLSLQFEPRLTNDSDHYSFFQTRIPVLHVDTGKHEHYHRPSDDVEHLNWDGLHRLVTLLTGVVESLASAPTLPPFHVDQAGQRLATALSTSKQSPPVRLGVTWKPDRIRENVFEVREVVAGSAADRAGLRPGDRLVQFDAWKNSSFMELRTAITVADPEVDLVWIEGTTQQERRQRLRLQGDPQRVGLQVRTDPVLPGSLVIEGVMETSPADRAGLVTGDILTAVDGQPLQTVADLERRAKQSSERLKLEGERAGRRFQIELFPRGTVLASTASDSSP